MELKLSRRHHIDPVCGQRGYSGFAGKSIAVGHVVARRHLHIEIFQGIPFQDFEKLEIIGENDQSLPFFFEGPNQVKALVTMPI
jgi:hypothetical protein